MNMRFENAPLVELIAEVHWSTQADTLFGSIPPGFPVQIGGDMRASTEQFFTRFAIEMDDLGFRNSERLLPQDSPVFPNTPALRFRRRAGEPPLIQVGSGVFTANGLPPTYSHWGDFRGPLSDGLGALLRSRDESESRQPFASVSVRYIDAFDERYWRGLTADQFISDVLGFPLNIPAGIGQHRDESRPLSMSQQYRVPLLEGGLMSVGIGDGFSNGVPAVVLEVTVEFQDVEPDLDVTMKRLEHAHTLINDMFHTVTSEIHDLMKPVEVE